MPDPIKVLAEQIVNELKGESKYRLFVPIIKDEVQSDREERPRSGGDRSSRGREERPRSGGDRSSRGREERPRSGGGDRSGGRRF
jgi:hypothetical protein